MSPQRLLWIALAAAGVPLLLEANTGCSLFVGGDEPDPFVPNAYTCECSCEQGDPLVDSRAVQSAADDAEEETATGTVITDSIDLDLAVGNLSGVRISQLGIPPGSIIESAHLQFTAEENGSGNADITIRIQASPTPLPFTASDGDLSDRATVPGVSVSWQPGDWTQNQSGMDERTPDLGELIQALVDGPEWDEVSSVVLLFDTTLGERIARNFEGMAPPVLELSYRVTLSARLPVCTEPGVPEDLDALDIDCAGRVKSSFDQLVEARGDVVNAASRCQCEVVQTGFRDLDGDRSQDEDEPGYFGFEHDACREPCEPNPLADDFSNFDPAEFDACLNEELGICANNQVPPEECVISDTCLAHASATHVGSGPPICIAAGASTDGDPEPIGRHLLGRASTCEVSGTSEILVGDGETEPKQDPVTRGTLALQGGPCPGTTCPVGFSSWLAMNPISFDVKFKKDPVFASLSQAGGSLPGAAIVGDAVPGDVPPGAAFAVSAGRRGSDHRAFNSENAEPLALTVDWTARQCRLEGNVAGTIDAEGLEGVCEGDGTTVCVADDECDGVGGPCDRPEDPEPLVVNVDLFGPLVNQPPTAHAGDSRSVECTSPEGATFTLDGRGSRDPDDGLGLFPDIRLATWREGGPDGPRLGTGLQVSSELGVGASNSYFLRVIDSFAQSDQDTTTVLVVDTADPVVSCNAPATITPDDVPDKHSEKPPLAFTATASDLCDADVVPEILDFDCFAVKRNGRRVDKTRSCEVAIAGDTITVEDSGGVGDHIAWTVRATDDSGNADEVTCEVLVVRP